MKSNNKNNRQSETAPKRKYIEVAKKAALHPVRAQILKALKEGAKTAMELEAITGESHYNLYYHLEALGNVGLVKTIPLDKKTKRYELTIPRRPEAAVLIFTENEIVSHPREFNDLLVAAEKLEKSEIPYRERIVRAEISFYYTWEQD